MEPMLKWLQGQLSLDGDELTKRIEAQPQLLGCSILTNLEPILDFNKDCIGIKGTQQLLAQNP
jgi:hypothetical protein